MRLISGLFSLAFLIILVTFVTHNTAPIEINFWPLDVQAAMPLSLMGLIFFASGIIIGMLLSLPHLWRGARQRHSLKKEIKKLNKEAKKKDEDSFPPSLLSRSCYESLTSTPEHKKKIKFHWPWKKRKPS